MRRGPRHRKHSFSSLLKSCLATKTKSPSMKLANFPLLVESLILFRESWRKSWIIDLNLSARSINAFVLKHRSLCASERVMGAAVDDFMKLRMGGVAGWPVKAVTGAILFLCCEGDWLITDWNNGTRSGQFVDSIRNSDNIARAIRRISFPSRSTAPLLHGK